MPTHTIGNKKYASGGNIWGAPIPIALIRLVLRRGRIYPVTHNTVKTEIPSTTIEKIAKFIEKRLNIFSPNYILRLNNCIKIRITKRGF